MLEFATFVSNRHFYSFSSASCSNTLDNMRQSRKCHAERSEASMVFTLRTADLRLRLRMTLEMRSNHVETPDRRMLGSRAGPSICFINVNKQIRYRHLLC